LSVGAWRPDGLPGFALKTETFKQRSNALKVERWQNYVQEFPVPRIGNKNIAFWRSFYLIIVAGYRVPYQAPSHAQKQQKAVLK